MFVIFFSDCAFSTDCAAGMECRLYKCVFRMFFFSYFMTVHVFCGVLFYCDLIFVVFLSAVDLVAEGFVCRCAFAEYIFSCEFSVMLLGSFQ